MQARVLITGVLVSFLLSCGQANQEPTGSSTSTSSDSNSTGAGNSDTNLSPSESPEASVSPVESGVTVAEAAQLTPSQAQELMSFSQQAERLQPGRPFRIMVPTYIPPGFQLNEVSASIDPSRRNWHGYGLTYKNPSSEVCFSVAGSSGGWGAGDFKRQDIKVFSEALGIVILAVAVPDRESDVSYIRFRDAPIQVNSRGYQFESGQEDGCKRETLEPQDAVKVVESLHYMDSPQTKAKLLEEVQRDANLLTAKFNFPLSSCGDSPSGSNDRWHPVFVDGTRVAIIQGLYCKDAVSKEKSQYGFEKVQVGSFTSYERALEFAKAVGGRVGEPNN